MLFRNPTARQINLGLAVLRVIVGAVFMVHGAQKLFVFGLGGVSGAFTQMGIPMPGLMGPLVAFVEFFGGIALVLGLVTRLASLGLAINMLGAIAFVHLKAGFFLPSGYEYALSLFGSAALLTLSGAGAYSVDAVIAGRESDVDTSFAVGSSRRAA